MIRTWPQFHRRVRRQQDKLLVRLDDYPRSILVTGCQRSGTTMLARLITGSDGMVNYWFGRDDELDAALILAGRHPETPRGRYCFQTTYLNECMPEYFEHSGHSIVWVLRNPHSVVYSMLHNWRRFALNELFEACGAEYLKPAERKWYDRLGVIGVSSLKRACYSYVGKVGQLARLADAAQPNQLIALDYDDLVRNKEAMLPRLYQQIGLSYEPAYAEAIRGGSVDKASKLREAERQLIDEICLPAFVDAKRYLTLLP
jgi:hypothetical protein